MLFGDVSQWFVPTAVHLVLLLLGVAFWSWRGVRGSGRWRARWWWSGLAVWAWLMAIPALANALVAAIEGPPAPPPDGPAPSAIVVLASGDRVVRAGQVYARLDAHGWARVSAAVQVWRAHGGVLVMAGGPPGNTSQSWAAAMRDVAISEGVPASTIMLADGSTNTYEDLVGAQAVVRTLHGAGPVWLVTSALHMPRALAIAKRLGMEVSPINADYQQLDELTWRAWWPNAGGPAIYASALHELIGLAIYRWRGWA